MLWRHWPHAAASFLPGTTERFSYFVIEKDPKVYQDYEQHVLREGKLH
jgi:hypothetical protein